VSTTLTIAQTVRAALRLHQAGSLHQAAQLYREVLEQDSNELNALHLYGTLCVQTGQYRKAEGLLRRAIGLLPNRASFYCNLGSSLRHQGRLKEALVAYQTSVSLEPESAHTQANLGLCLQEIGRVDEAIEVLQFAVHRDPLAPQYGCGLAQCYQAKGWVKDAVAILKAVVTNEPSYVDAWIQLGTCYKSAEQMEDAEGLFRRSLLLRETVDGHLQLGDTLLRQGRDEEARRAYERALQLAPHSASPRIRLATGMAPVWDSVEALNRGRRRLEDGVRGLAQWEGSIHQPEYAAGQTQFFLAYHGLNNRSIHEQMARFYRRNCPSLTWVSPHCERPRRARNRIRVGVVSSLFDGNTIGRLWGEHIARLDRSRFEVFVYSFQEPNTEMGRYILDKSDSSRLLPRSAVQARWGIARDELDVLWYPEIGMDLTVYFLAFYRLAHVQCVSWGHPETTGIDTMDYFLSSESMEPPGASSHYSEELVLMREVMTCFRQPDPVCPTQGREHFGLPVQATLYGCLQSLFKLHPVYDALWCDILRRDPDGILVLLEGRYPRWTEATRRRLSALAPDLAHRIVFVPRMKRQAYLAVVACCDVVLDTPGFGGGNTTLEALSFGKPVVTLPGEFMRSRLSYALYHQIGVMDCVATSREHYVQIALRMGTDQEARCATSSRIRQAASRLFDNADSVREMEQFMEWAVTRTTGPARS